MNDATHWELAPATPLLQTNIVHVWCAALDQPAQIHEQLQGNLSSDEQAHAAKLVFERNRHHFIVGRGVLRIILSAYLNVPPETVRFFYGPYGKPYLPATKDSSLKFNLSHSHGFAVYAVTQGEEIGVDLEYIRSVVDRDELVAHNFSQHERAVFATLPAQQKDVAFFNGWTRKEAIIKAIGDGLRYPLDQFSVSLEPNEPVRLLSLDGDSSAVSQWSLVSFTPQPGYLAALAMRGALTQIAFWTWHGNKIFRNARIKSV